MADRNTLVQRGFWVDDWFVEPQVHRIVHGEESVQLEPKVMDVLLCLAERPGKTISKDYFMDEVWEGTVVTDDVLSRCISELRKVLGDDARDPQFIETIRKAGYRLIAPVSLPSHEEAQRNGTGGGAVFHRERQPASFALIVRLLCQWTARKARRVRARPLLWGPALVVLLALLTGSLWGLRQLFSTETTAPPEVVPFTSFPGQEYDPALSPDERQIAFVWNGGSSPDVDLYLKQSGAETPLRLTDRVADEHSPAWSPDGRQIAFVRSDSSHAVYVVPSIGGSERKIADFGAREVQGLAWSPTGQTMAVSVRATSHGSFGLVLFSMDDGEERPLTTPPDYVRGDLDPAFSPDGTQIAFIRSVDAEMEDVYVTPVEGGAVVRLTSDSTSVTGVDWSADGKSILFASGRKGMSGLWQVPASGGTPTWILTANEGNSLHDISVGRETGTVAYAQRSFDTNIWRLWRSQRYGSYQAHPLIFSTRWDSHPQIAPDGERVIFVSKRSGSNELWSCNRDGSDPVQLTSLRGPMVGMPRWSPDGRLISFVSRKEGHADLYVMDAEGGPPRRLTTSPSDDMMPSWSHDGRWLYFASNRSGTWQVWKRSVLGGDAFQVTRGGGRAAFESADGRWLYYVKPDEAGIWLVPLAHGPVPIRPLLPVPVPRIPVTGGPEQQIVTSLAPADWGNWAVTTDGIYFIRRDGEKPMLAFYRFSTGAEEEVHALDQVPRHPSLTAAPDGSWFLYTQIDRNESDILLLQHVR